MPIIEQIPIACLRRGEIASVSQLVGPPDLIRRIEELGLRCGTLFEIVRGGSPCILRVNGATLCFREDERVSILVSPRKTA